MKTSRRKPFVLVQVSILCLLMTLPLSGQTAGALLQLQRSTAFLQIDSNAQHARGMYGITFGNPGDVWHFPNALSCLIVYGDGKYVYERRDEATVGKPKIRAAEGSLTPDELQQLKTILEEPGFAKITSPAMPEMPDNTVTIREMETLSAQVDHSGKPQEFVLVKERVKTTAATGMDTLLDNGAQYQKALNPLQKWFKDIEKKGKSGLKDAEPKFCRPMNIG